MAVIPVLVPPSINPRLPDRFLSGAHGFTLLELSVGLVILSAIVSLAVPIITQATREARSTTVVNDLRLFSAALQTYARERGDWPAGTSEPGVFPPGMEGYLRTTNWARRTPLGGFYTWSPNTLQQGQRYRAAIAIASVDADKISSDRAQFVDLDRKLDDGILETGQLRLGFRNHPFYVLEP